MSWNRRAQVTGRRRSLRRWSHLTPDQRADARAAHADWMLAHARTVHHLQNARSAEATRLLRRELAKLRVALTRLIDDAAWDEAGRLGVLVALAVSDDPHLDLLGQLHRLEGVAGLPEIAADARGLGAIAAGAAAWLQGDTDTAERLLTAGVDALPATNPRRWIGVFFRVAARMRPGRVAAVEADTLTLLADTAAPAWVQATAVCCAALICLFAGDHRTGQRWMSEHDELLADVGRSDGFVAYTRGELLAGEDPNAALSWFDLAYRQCDVAGHTYNREVAAIGRAAVLIRLGRHAEAVPACRRLIDDLRGLGMWPQVWICVRLTAELFVARDDPEPAAGLLAAADRDPLAPPLLGPDADRRAALWARIARRLGDDRLAVATRRGAAGGRTGAVQLALAALDRHR
jgi:hypothetical protein